MLDAIVLTSVMLLSFGLALALSFIMLSACLLIVAHTYESKVAPMRECKVREPETELDWPTHIDNAATH